MNVYRCIVADPPWPERGAGQYKRGADRYYPLMSRTEIAAAMLRAPVWRPAMGGCHLWVWATSNHLPSALWLIDVLGFAYVSSAVWIKPSPGLGQYMRHQHEWLLLAKVGEAMVPKPSVRPSSIVAAPKRGHSVKPSEAYDLIEAVSPAPRLEMFARALRVGWDVWGDEVQP